LNNFLTYKYSHHQTIEFILIFILLLFPKIDLIPISYYHQGIRIEDLVVVYIGISLYFSNSLEIQKKDFGYFFYIYFAVMLMAMIHGSLYFNQKWITVLRYLEYIIILIYFNRNNPSIESIFFILRTYLLLNLIFVILQQNGLVGEFSSLGYENPAAGEMSDSRPTGLAGGPWELSNCCAIIFFALLLDKKQSIFSKYTYSFIAIFLILATHSRTIVVSFALSAILYFIILNLNKKKFYLFLFLLVALATFIILYIKNIYSGYADVYLELIPMFKNFVFYKEIPELETLDGELWSIAFRLEHWITYYNQFLQNSFTIVFGSGYTTLYYESILFRVLFGTGIFGLIFVIYIIKNIPLHILLLIFVSGLTLDLLLSFKIYFTMLLYFYIENKLKYDYRN